MPKENYDDRRRGCSAQISSGYKALTWLKRLHQYQSSVSLIAIVPMDVVTAFEQTKEFQKRVLILRVLLLLWKRLPFSGRTSVWGGCFKISEHHWISDVCYDWTEIIHVQFSKDCRADLCWKKFRDFFAWCSIISFCSGSIWKRKVAAIVTGEPSLHPKYKEWYGTCPDKHVKNWYHLYRQVANVKKWRSFTALLG
jgi:hypothetical protein